MIAEMRTKQMMIAVGPAVADQFAAALPDRTALSPLADFWSTRRVAQYFPLNSNALAWSTAVKMTGG